MFCQKCGKEIHDEAVVCIHCGCAVNGVNNRYGNDEETSSLATLSIVFAFLMPIVGLILGICGCVKYRDENYKTTSSYGIVLSIVMWIVYGVILSLAVIDF